MDQGRPLTPNRRMVLGSAAMLASGLALGRAASADAAAGTTSLKLVLDWFANPNHAPLILADSLGLFAKRGLSVELIEPADPNDPPKLVAAGQADMCISYQPQLMMQVDKGLPIGVFGVLVDSPLNMLLALGGDSGIKSIADLKGRKIGYSVGGFEDALLSTMLGTAGIGLSDVQLINVNFSLAQSLLAGTVDAVIGAYRNYELNVVQAQGKPTTGFFVEDYGVPRYDELVFVSKRVAKQDRAKLRLVLEAVREAIGLILAKPDDAWAAFAAKKPQLNDALNKKAFQDTLPKYARDAGLVDPGKYNDFAAYLKNKSLVSEARPASDYLIPSA